MVGATGFEPATTCTPSVPGSRASVINASQRCGTLPISTPPGRPRIATIRHDSQRFCYQFATSDRANPHGAPGRPVPRRLHRNRLQMGRRGGAPARPHRERHSDPARRSHPFRQRKIAVMPAPSSATGECCPCPPHQPQRAPRLRARDAGREGRSRISVVLCTRPPLCLPQEPTKVSHGPLGGAGRALKQQVCAPTILQPRHEGHGSSSLSRGVLASCVDAGSPVARGPSRPLSPPAWKVDRSHRTSDVRAGDALPALKAQRHLRRRAGLLCGRRTRLEGE